MSAKLTDYNHVDLLHEHKYLRAGDLRGRDVVVTIERIEPREELHNPATNKKERKPVVYFVGKEKGFVMNVTNARTIAKAHGTAVEGWIGKQITLYPTIVRCKGEMVEAIRIRSTTTTAKTPAGDELGDSKVAR